MEEYETLCADSAENCKTIVDWMFSGLIYVQSQLPPGDFSRSAVGEIQLGRTYRRKKPAGDVLLNDPEEIARGIDLEIIDRRLVAKGQNGGWLEVMKQRHNYFDAECVQKLLDAGYEFRLKPGHALPPKKVKKLVDRTPEELTNFIGVAFFRKVTRKDIFRLVVDNLFPAQEGYEISFDRGKNWEPMQKTVECDA